MKLDAHQHLWSYSAAEYPWIPAGSPLHRDWLPADLAALQTPLGLDGAIAVQARQTLEESRWLLAQADANPVIRGVVGWVDLRSERVEEQLAPLAACAKFVGVRHVAQEEPDDFLARAEVIRGIGKLRAFGLAYDILIYERQLPAALTLARALPEQPFVVDHLAKPRIRDGALEPWRSRMRELAALPNVHCKVSGLVTEADHARWQPDDLRPYLDAAFELFGPERLMWGSDWPVCLFAASYERVFRLVEEYAAQLDAAARAKVFGENAARFYLTPGSLPGA